MISVHNNEVSKESVVSGALLRECWPSLNMFPTNNWGKIVVLHAVLHDGVTSINKYGKPSINREFEIQRNRCLVWIK